MTDLKDLQTDIRIAVQDSNQDNLKLCSICGYCYTVERRVMMFYPCQHILCERCSKNMKKCEGKCAYKCDKQCQKCECCGKKVYKVDFAPSDVQKKLTGIESTSIISFNVSDMMKRGKTYPICRPSESTLPELVKYLLDEKGITVQSFLIANKQYVMNDKSQPNNKKLTYAGILYRCLVKCVEVTKGG